MSQNKNALGFLLILAIVGVAFLGASGFFKITVSDVNVGQTIIPHVLIPSHTFFSSKEACQQALPDGKIYYTLIYSGPLAKSNIEPTEAATRKVYGGSERYTCAYYSWADLAFESPLHLTGQAAGEFSLSVSYANSNGQPLGQVETAAAKFIGQSTTTSSTTVTTTSTTSSTSSGSGGGATSTTTFSPTTLPVIPTPTVCGGPCQPPVIVPVGSGNEGGIGDWFNIDVLGLKLPVFILAVAIISGAVYVFRRRMK